MPKLRFPDLPPGPLRELLGELHRFHARAGWPSVRTIGKAVDASHYTVHQLFTKPCLPSLPVLLKVTDFLAGLAPRADSDEWCDRIDSLWTAAERYEALYLDLSSTPGRSEGPLPSTASGSQLDRHDQEAPLLASEPASPGPSGPTALLRSPELPDPDTSRAALIGSATYSDTTLTSLPSVPTAVRDLSSILTGLGGGTPFHPDHTSTLIDPHTPLEVLEAFDQAASEAKDTLLLYYAGHGLITRSGELTLATRDSVPDAEYTTVRYDAVRELIARSPAKRSLVILDCCFSGRAVDAMGTMSGTVEAPSTYVIASAGSRQVAFAPAEARYPSFTGALIDVLLNGVPGDPEVLDVERIFRAVADRLRQQRLPAPEWHTRTGGRMLGFPNRGFRDNTDHAAGPGGSRRSD